MKRLYLVRGLPGSGKSTVARALADSALIGGEAIEADEFFVDADGAYRFDGTKLGDAHRDCLERARALMVMPGTRLVAVANTFSQQWEMEPYYLLAEELEWTFTTLECVVDFGRLDPEREKWRRRFHDVPESAIQRMRDRWERVESFVSGDR